MATAALTPEIGYDRAAAIAKEAFRDRANGSRSGNRKEQDFPSKGIAELAAIRLTRRPSDGDMPPKSDTFFLKGVNPRWTIRIIRNTRCSPAVSPGASLSLPQLPQAWRSPQGQLGRPEMEMSVETTVDIKTPDGTCRDAARSFTRSWAGPMPP